MSIIAFLYPGSFPRGFSWVRCRWCRSRLFRGKIFSRVRAKTSPSILDFQSLVWGRQIKLSPSPLGDCSLPLWFCGSSSWFIPSIVQSFEESIDTYFLRMRLDSLYCILKRGQLQSEIASYHWLLSARCRTDSTWSIVRYWLPTHLAYKERNISQSKETIE